MKKIIFLILICKSLAYPIQSDRIIFPDEFKNLLIDDSVDDLEFDQMSLLNDPNILKPDNISIEFMFDPHRNNNLENGEYFQGDMILSEEQLQSINNTGDLSSRTGKRLLKYRWPKDNSGKVNVPFQISNEFKSTDESRIMQAMSTIERHTCIRFEKQKSQKDFIQINSEKGCSSYVGKISGNQTVSLQRFGCLTHGIIIHELMHALGFEHMHSHANRDEFVKINWSNVKEEEKHNFEKVNSNFYDNFETPYDYYSVMHYDLHSFGIDKKETTIEPIDKKFKTIIGQRLGLSKGDKARLNAMYDCDM